eukprot:comp24161_c0_seq1/m.44053 comp24161_c0_seq1/g.44053  ORF comp24161_c0_seq1/g.44053 comp24161_c0_seq1/m.44053 type:complete len:1046 (-) comp24161_c0_seq1:238-3375(-)
MRAFLLDGLRKLVESKFGEVAVAVVDDQARAWVANEENRTQEKIDADLNSGGYVTAVKEFLGIIHTDDLLALCGEYWVRYVDGGTSLAPSDERGMAAFLRAVTALNELHHELGQTYGLARFPFLDVDRSAAKTSTVFRVTCVCDDAPMVLMVKGMIRELCRVTLRDVDISNPVEITSGDKEAHTQPNSTDIKETPTVSVGVANWLPEGTRRFVIELRVRRKSVVEAEKFRTSKFGITGPSVDMLFPFHVAFNMDLEIEQVGSHLLRMCPDLAIGSMLTDHFSVVRPHIKRVCTQSIVGNLDSLFVLQKKLPDGKMVVLNGQMVHFEREDLLVFLGCPTLQSLRNTDSSLFDLPIFTRVADIPFNFKLTEVEVDPSTITTQGKEASECNGEGEDTVLQLPTRDMLRSYSAGHAGGLSKEELVANNRIKLYKWHAQSAASTAAKSQVDFTAPVQKILAALQKLRSNVDPDIQGDIDTVLNELHSAYDVYLPSIEGRFDKQGDPELSDYMASFFPRQSTVKFDHSRSNSLVPSAGSLSTRRVSDGSIPAVHTTRRDSLEASDKEGFVYLGSPEDGGSWRQRYFVLSDWHIYYFRDDDAESLPIGMVDLQRYMHCRQVSAGSLRCVELSSDPTSEVRKYYFHAADTKETEEWMQALMDKYTEIRMSKQQADWDRLVETRTALPDGTSKSTDSQPMVVFDVTIDVPRRMSLKESHWLTELGDLDFDIFKVAEATNGRPLQFIGKAIFQNLGLLEKFQITESKLDNFLRCMERGYRKENSYHNATHAADVTQTLYYFLITLRLSQYISELDVFAAIVAAIIHDFMHPGTNNAYQINNRAPEAMLYNDQSVLENMHLTKAFQVLADEDCNILCGLTDTEYRHVRAVIVQMVLNTDMSLHFELTGKFKSAITLMASEGTLGTGHRLPNNTIMLVLAMALHCADISNPIKKFHLYIQWAHRVMEEFWRQGDSERAKGQPISPMCDRQTVTMAKCQLSFITFIVEPLFLTFSDFAPEVADECIPNLRMNKESWMKIQAAEEKAKEATSSNSPEHH